MPTEEHGHTDTFIEDLANLPSDEETDGLDNLASRLAHDVIQSAIQRERRAQLESLEIVAQSTTIDDSKKEELDEVIALFRTPQDSSSTFRTSQSDPDDDIPWMSGEVFSDTLRANAAAEEVLTESFTKELADTEKKAADSVKQHAKSFPKRAIQATYIGALLLTGAALTFFSHGFLSTQGGAFIAEALDQLDNLIDDHPLEQHEEEFRSKNKKLTAVLEAHNKENNDTINIAWKQQIENHCKEQKRTLEKITEYLKKETVHHDYFIDEINTLYNRYEKEEEALKAITTFNTVDATDKIRNIAFNIERVEKKAIPLIEHVKSALPPKAESHCKTFIHRAKNFYRTNKDICKIVGLVSLTALGIGLTIATGGIGGLLGAAALCVVANAGIKSIFTRVKKAITGYVNDSILDMHSENLAKHCKLQKKSLDQIGESINSIKNPLTRKEIATDSEEYTKNIQALHDIKSNDEHNFFKLKKLISLSAAIEKLDKKAHEKLKKANGLLPEDSIKESINFMKRSQITHDENQKTMLAIKKTTLAVAAITTLSIAIKGTGFFIAVATAAVSSLLSFTIKKVSGFTKENALKMEKESEDEGGKKTETDSNSKSKNVHPHN